MALIQTQPTIAPETQAATQIRQIATDLYSAMLPKYIQAYNLVWRNPRATPDKVITEMGTDAVQLFTVSAALAQLLVASGASNIPLTMPSGWNFVAHTDGSVTISKVE